MVYVCTMEDDVKIKDLEMISKIGTYSAIDLGGYGGVHMSKKRRNKINEIKFCQYKRYDQSLYKSLESFD